MLQQKGWEPWGALGRGGSPSVVSHWLPLGWAVQQHWRDPWVVLTGLFLPGVWSTVVCGAHWDLWSLLCPTGSRGTGTGSFGALLEEAHMPSRSPALWDAPAAWPEHVGMHVLGKKVPGNFLGFSQGELGSGNFLPSPLSPPSSLTHCSQGHKRL